MPCLDEAETVAACVEKALRGLAAAGVTGEVVVADNGSTGGSLEKGLAFALLACTAGGLLLVGAVNQWRLAGFGDLDYARTMRWVIPGATHSCSGYRPRSPPSP